MAKEKGSKRTVLIAVIAALAVVAAGSVAYIVYSSYHSHRIYRNFQFDNATLVQTESIFSNATSQQEVNSYCSQGNNMIYCGYYCAKINPSGSFCAGIPQPKYSAGGNYGAPMRIYNGSGGGQQ